MRHKAIKKTFAFSYTLLLYVVSVAEFIIFVNTIILLRLNSYKSTECQSLIPFELTGQKYKYSYYQTNYFVIFILFSIIYSTIF